MHIYNVKSVYADIINTMRSSNIINAYNGSCNLIAEYLNDYSNHNNFVAEFLQENASKLDCNDIECILDNPDYMMQCAASDFYSQVNVYTDKSLSNCKWCLSSGSENYYFYANPWSNACYDFYIIRADNECEALDILLDEFASDFWDDSKTDEDIEKLDHVSCNIDNLVLLAQVTFIKA
jgi:hypothetical protein